MTVRKIAGRLHLWLGLLTGPVVLIIGLTGAIYCFAPELQSLQPYRTVKDWPLPFLPPSAIRSIAEGELPGRQLQRIYYDAPDKSVMVLFGKGEEYSYSVFIDPYYGRVLKVRNNHRDFLSVVLRVHRNLAWPPYGHEIVRWSTVVFLLILISGWVLWWPRNRRTVRQGFRIRWKASSKRLNYDLHRVMGFYITWIAIFAALTGLLFAFEPYARFIYNSTGAQRSVIQPKAPLSDTALRTGNAATGADAAWKALSPELHGRYASLMFVFPAAPEGSLLVRCNPDRTTLYRSDFRYFDQYSGRAIPGAYVWGRHSDVRTASDHIRRTNYDLHTGAFFGLPGRVALFFAALIVSSLPVTGFLFWWGRRHKRRTAGKK